MKWSMSRANFSEHENKMFSLWLKFDVINFVVDTSSMELVHVI